MLVVPYLVCEHCHDLVGAELLYKRVVEHDALFGAEACEIGIGLGAAF